MRETGKMSFNFRKKTWLFILKGHSVQGKMPKNLQHQDMSESNNWISETEETLWGSQLERSSHQSQRRKHMSKKLAN